MNIKAKLTKEAKLKISNGINLNITTVTINHSGLYFEFRRQPKKTDWFCFKIS